MEKWKIGVIVALLAGLVGYGALQQGEGPANPQTDPLASEQSQQEKPALVIATEPSASAKAYLGQTLAETPAWDNVTQWTNTQAPISKASLQGSVALVEVFRTGCSHCEQAVPFMEALYTRYAPRGLKMVALQSPGDVTDPTNPESDWQAVQFWMKQRGVQYPVGFDAKGVWFQGRVKGDRYPTMLIFDREGKVSLAHTGYDGGKAAALAVELEKRLPGAGSTEARAQNLAQWIAPFYGASDDATWKNNAVKTIEAALQ